MKLYMETTKISPEQTVSDIQRILGRYGANAVMTEYEDGEVVGVSFRIVAAGNQIPFILPCRFESIYNVLCKRRKRLKREDEKKLYEQAKRVAWRQILRWVEAQIALSETEMVKLQEVFLPYVQTGLNETLYQKIEKQNFKAIGVQENEKEEI